MQFASSNAHFPPVKPVKKNFIFYFILLAISPNLGCIHISNQKSNIMERFNLKVTNQDSETLSGSFDLSPARFRVISERTQDIVQFFVWRSINNDKNGDGGINKAEMIAQVSAICTSKEELALSMFCAAEHMNKCLDVIREREALNFIKRAITDLDKQTKASNGTGVDPKLN